MKDLGYPAAETDHQRESKEHSQAEEAGEVRFGGLGLLSDKNGQPVGAGSIAKHSKLARSVLKDLGC